MLVNAVGRVLPERIGDYIVKPYQGLDAVKPVMPKVVSNRRPALRPESGSKVVNTLEQAIKVAGLEDGMTISFHHSFREGDLIVGQVLTAIRNLGIKNLRFAPSAVVNIKNPSIVDFVRDGTINRIEASGIRGELEMR